jgi:hypothetical protein
VLGQLLPSTGATGEHSQGERRHASVGHSDSCRSCRAGGCPSVSKDTNRKGTHPAVTFDFLGYSFRPRLAAWRGGKYGVSFLPAAADKALKKMRKENRRWVLQTRTDKALDDFAQSAHPRLDQLLQPHLQVGALRLFARNGRAAITSASGTSRKPRVSCSRVSSGPTRCSLRTGSFSMRHGWMLGAG